MVWRVALTFSILAAYLNSHKVSNKSVFEIILPKIGIVLGPLVNLLDTRLEIFLMIQPLIVASGSPAYSLVQVRFLIDYGVCVLLNYVLTTIIFLTYKFFRRTCNFVGKILSKMDSVKQIHFVVCVLFVLGFLMIRS